jgi:PKD repeat protein
MNIRNTIVVAILALSVYSCDRDEDPVVTKASFSIGGITSAAPVTINFINNSSNASSYLWNFGDGTTSTTMQPTHTYGAAGTFLVTLKATGVTTDSVCKIISIEPPFAANRSAFSYFLDKCSGNLVGAAFYSLNPASSNTVWNFDGVLNTSRDPLIQFIVPGDYTVKYSSQIGGVRDTVTRIIRLY